MRTAAGLHAHHPFRRQHLGAHQSFRILTRIDVIGDYTHIDRVGQHLAQCRRQRRLAGADRSANADT